MSKLPQAYTPPDFAALAKDICDRHPAEVAQYLYGKALLGFLMGKVMIEGKGTINPTLMIQALISELESRRQS